MPIKISPIPRGSVPHDGWWFTSIRFPLDLAKRFDALAKHHNESRSNVIISLINASIDEAESDVGPLPPSDLQASEHAKPPPKGKVLSKEQMEKKALKVSKSLAAESSKKPKQVAAPKPAKVKTKPVEEEEEVPVPKANKSGFRVKMQIKGGKVK
jgi:hypothetical protein